MKIIAHRGASHCAPENSARALALAQTEGADGAEMDLHVTADGHWLLHHDPHTRRSTGEDVVIREHPFSALHALRPFGERWVLWEETDPLWTADFEGWWELKTLPPPLPPFDQLSPRARAAGRLLSFFPETLDACRAVAPDLPRVLLLDDPRRIPNPVTLFESALAALPERFQGLALHHGWSQLSPAHLRSWREQAQFRVVWTVDDAAQAAFWRDLGATHLITNAPGPLRAALA